MPREINTPNFSATAIPCTAARSADIAAVEGRRTRMSSAAYTPSHVPVRSGPRLQAGDILLIGGRTCRVKALLPKSKAVACEVWGCRGRISLTLTQPSP